MKPIAEWPLYLKVASLVGVFGTISTALSSWPPVRDALAEIIPYTTKAFVADQIVQLEAKFVNQNSRIQSSLDTISWNQLLDRERTLSAAIEVLRTQLISLQDMIEREQDHDEQIKKKVRLAAAQAELSRKEADYARVQCQINARDYNARCN